MKPSRILVAGIGNIFLGDDAFGVEVVRRLMLLGLPEEVRIVDFGIRGLDLSYALLDGYEAVVMVDAAPRGNSPGTLYLLEIDASETPEPEGTPLFEMHALDPVKVLRMAAAMGARLDRLYLVGCEPSPAGEEEEMQSGLSVPVRAAVDEAVDLVASLVRRLVRGEPIEMSGDSILTHEEVERCRT
jgi:hydrogenase maturation protease